MARFNDHSSSHCCEMKIRRRGKRLTARMNTSRQENGETVSNRQVGYGLVFGVPKSLSIYLAITGDQVVENIARSAVDETMRRNGIRDAVQGPEGRAGRGS